MFEIDCINYVQLNYECIDITNRSLENEKTKKKGMWYMIDCMQPFMIDIVEQCLKLILSLPYVLLMIVQKTGKYSIIGKKCWKSMILCSNHFKPYSDYCFF